MPNDEVNEALAEELKEITRYLKVLSANAVMNLINKIATTPERQQMWRLADGSLSNEEIAKQIGVTLRTVQYFVQEAENTGLLVTEKRGYPKRIEDIFPKEWKPWKPSKEKITGQETAGEQT
jgi:transposase